MTWSQSGSGTTTDPCLEILRTYFTKIDLVTEINITTNMCFIFDLKKCNEYKEQKWSRNKFNERKIHNLLLYYIKVHKLKCTFGNERK